MYVHVHVPEYALYVHMYNVHMYLSSRLVLRVAAEVEPQEFPCSLLGDGNGGGSQVPVHHPDVSMEETEGLCQLEQTILDLNRVNLILLQGFITTCLHILLCTCTCMYMCIGGQGEGGVACRHT